MKIIQLALAILMICRWPSPGHAQDSIAWMSFSKDHYLPGTFDDQGNYLNGAELMRLTACKGKLYAATSVFKDSYGIAPYSEYAGCQVLRKDSAAAPWRVDVSFGSRCLRADALEKITFTHDSLGNPLPLPVDMLVAVFNLMGQLILAEKKSGSQFNIQTGYLKPGVYLLQLRTGEGRVITRKFMKE